MLLDGSLIQCVGSFGGWKRKFGSNQGHQGIYFGFLGSHLSVAAASSLLKSVPSHLAGDNKGYAEYAFEKACRYQMFCWILKIEC